MHSDIDFSKGKLPAQANDYLFNTPYAKQSNRIHLELSNRKASASASNCGSNLLLTNGLFKRLLQNVLSLNILDIHVAQFPRTLF